MLNTFLKFQSKTTMTRKYLIFNKINKYQLSIQILTLMIISKVKMMFKATHNTNLTLILLRKRKIDLEANKNCLIKSKNKHS